MLATLALAGSSMTAQPSAKRGAHSLSPEARQNVETTVAGAPQMLVRSQATASSRMFSSTSVGTLTLPGRSAMQQMRQATGGVDIWGNVIYSDKPEGSSSAAHLGIWKISTSGEFESVYPTSLGG